MPKFRNLDELEEYIREQLKESLSEDVVQTVKEVEIDEIEDKVYNVYPNPQQYQRRGSNGGLLDIENIVATPIFNGNYFSIKNLTKKYQINEYLAPLIEFGHNRAVALGYRGYDFERYGLAYMNPRPFTQSTIDRLERSKEHVKAMKEGMKARGFRVR